MRKAFIITLFAVLIGCTTTQRQAGVPLKRSVFCSLSEKPHTTIKVEPKDAAEYWKRIVPAHLAMLPCVTKEFISDEIYKNFIVNSGMSTGEYSRLTHELSEFKRTNAHKFWEPYAGKIITVAGGHYCPCCFYAAIGYMGKGYADGWTIRLDEYIAIGFPQGSTCYTDNPAAVGMTKCPLSPLDWIVEAVGEVKGPYTITDDLGGMMSRQANAYYILKQIK